MLIQFKVRFKRKEKMKILHAIVFITTHLMCTVKIEEKLG